MTTARSRRVYFEDEIRAAEARRTRGHSQSSRSGRSRSADRVHGLFDDTQMAQGRDRVVGREAYDQLLRENQYLRIELRELESAQAWIDQLRRENAELRQENRELRRAGGYASSDVNDGAAGHKDTKLRKKMAKLEVEVDELKAKLSDAKAKTAKWRALYDELNQAYEDIRRRERDAQRRVDIVRQNITLVEEAKTRLEQENASLKLGIDLDLEDRLRRRQNY
ncbi:uncharacterized protein P884DRAFT_293718 [Thermothelomyces heterothallicus CBS 202.75]|uniref:uncharacterized protein n=1 Tax=Thermothelomyces heterothallicus CBS 202.75 TaxID=1149848 RepID=UPI0037431597